MAVDQDEVDRLTTELATVRAAIEDILLHGIAHGANGRSLTKADLGVLYDRETRLEAKLARAERGGSRPIYQAVPRG